MKDLHHNIKRVVETLIYDISQKRDNWCGDVVGLVGDNRGMAT